MVTSIENPTTESAIDVIRKSKGKFITVAFVKRTTGEVIMVLD